MTPETARSAYQEAIDTFHSAEDSAERIMFGTAENALACYLHVLCVLEMARFAEKWNLRVVDGAAVIVDRLGEAHERQWDRPAADGPKP